MQQLMTITTDFGDQFAASQLRAVIAGLGFEGQVIENHSVTPFSISEGAFEIQQLARFSPSGSIHVGVVDPGVGTKRWGIIIRTKRSWFVGPNNGLLYPAAVDEGIVGVWRLTEAAFRPLSHTFHGRDLFVKAGVFLSQRKAPEEFESVRVDENTLEERGFIDGEVVHIDTYGNAKVYWPYPVVEGQQLRVTSRTGVWIIPVTTTFGEVPAGHALALLGSHGTLEIAVNLGSAAKRFGFSLGETLIIKQL